MSNFKFLEDSNVVAVRAHLCDQTRVMIARTALFNREYARRLGDRAHGTIWQKPDEVTAQMTGFCSATVRRCIDIANLSIVPKCADRIGVSVFHGFNKKNGKYSFTEERAFITENCIRRRKILWADDENSSCTQSLLFGESTESSSRGKWMAPVKLILSEFRRLKQRRLHWMRSNQLYQKLKPRKIWNERKKRKNIIHSPTTSPAPARSTRPLLLRRQLQVFRQFFHPLSKRLFSVGLRFKLRGSFVLLGDRRHTGSRLLFRLWRPRKSRKPFRFIVVPEDGQKRIERKMTKRLKQSGHPDD